MSRAFNPETTVPCKCGGQGRGFNGFHYPHAQGCLLPDPEPASIATPPGLKAGLDEAVRRSREEAGYAMPGITPHEAGPICKWCREPSTDPTCAKCSAAFEDQSFQGLADRVPPTLERPSQDPAPAYGADAETAANTARAPLDLAAMRRLARVAKERSIPRSTGRRPLNQEAFGKLIDEDYAWCKAQPHTIERDHVIAVLQWSKGAFYATERSDVHALAATVESLSDALETERREHAASAADELKIQSAFIAELQQGVALLDSEGRKVKAQRDRAYRIIAAAGASPEGGEEAGAAQIMRWFEERQADHAAFEKALAQRDGDVAHLNAEIAKLRDESKKTAVAARAERGVLRIERDAARAAEEAATKSAAELRAENARMKFVVEAALSEFDAFTLMNDRIARAVKAYRGAAS